MTPLAARLRAKRIGSRDPHRSCCSAGQGRAGDRLGGDPGVQQRIWL